MVALVIAFNTLDWSLWRILVSEALVQSHCYMPHSIHLYIRSLLSRDSLLFLPSNQDISLSFKFNCCLFILMCFCHVSFWQSYKPRYFTSVCTGIGTLFIVTCGQMVRFVVNVTSANFVCFILIFQVLNQVWSKFIWFCRNCAARTGS